MKIMEVTRPKQATQVPVEETIRVENGGEMRRTTQARGCLYCALQLPDTAEFCPQCGRAIETGFAIRPIEESELACSHKEMKGKDGLLPQRMVLSDGRSPLTWKNLHTLESAQSGEHGWSRVNGYYSSGQNDKLLVEENGEEYSLI